MCQSAHGQQSRRSTVVPFVGVGGFDRVGPIAQLGLRVQHEYTPVVVASAEVASWSLIATCSESRINDVRGCVSNGLAIDLGINAQANGSGIARPYVGAGVGAARAGVWATAVNTHAGISLGGVHGAQFQAELRMQRALGKIDAVAGMLTVGVGFAP